VRTDLPHGVRGWIRLHHLTADLALVTFFSMPEPPHFASRQSEHFRS
jgi:hypothetical protein